MFGIGGGEIIFIIFIALMLFGTDKLPEAVRTFAKVMATLKNATNEIKSEIQKNVDLDDLKISAKSITSNFDDEVNLIKKSVTDATSNTISDATSGVEKIKEDFENLTGPIKRQL